MSLKDEKEIDAILDESMPEAKSSVSYSLYSKDGFSVIFTVRSSNEGELLELMGDLEKSLIKRGYSPKFGSAKSDGFVVSSKELKTGLSSGTGVCPKCGSPLVKFDTKTGKSGMKCSTAKWDWENKKASGCDYVEWDDAPIQTTINEATPAQIDLLKKKNQWVEGMSKSEASARINSLIGGK